jgi:L,D-peptidoglycan transpeptidase YkuD (ErfK/YbiS/YcfS/YnhG family)
VLIGRLARRFRPAASPRRRSFLFGGLAATIGVSFAAGSWEPPERSQPTTLEAARRAASTAVATLRQPAPERARLVERLIADAEVVTAGERNAPSWERTPGRTEDAWARTLSAAHAGLVELRQRERRDAGRWQALRLQVAAEVRRALAEANEAGVGRREISAAKQASYKWDLAQRYATSGALDRAVAEAEQVRVLTRIVRDGFVALHARYGDRRQLAEWRQLVEETVAQSRATGEIVFVVDKLKRKLHVYDAGFRVATYDAELGVKGLRRKLHSGDQATPEGRYRVTELRGPGRTKYYKALMIDYPNAVDRARYSMGRRSGQVPARAGIGSLIEIHGDGGQGRDWTDGCVALVNRDMDRVFALARVGTPVTIVGTF